MQWCGSILCQVHIGVYAVCSAGCSRILHYTQHTHQILVLSKTNK
jgi:hypothetical protein